MKKFFIAVGLVSMVFTGCKKSFLDINRNPNTTTSAPAINVFTGALSTTGNTMVSPSLLGGAWSGIYGFSTSFTGGGAEKTYVFSNANYDFWGPIYDNITDYNYVINNATEEAVPYLVGPAMVMKAFQFQKLVDSYGNIPYTEAFNLTNVTPAYDKGQFIYEDLIKKLDSAITIMKAATFPATVSQDIVFKGNKTNWIRLANTIKLRILIRQDKIAGRTGYLATEVNKILTEGTGFLTANVFINPGYLKQTGKLNPFYANIGYNENDVEQTNHRFYKVSQFMIDFLKNTKDTFRLQRKADMKVQGNNGNKDDFSNYVGVTLGQRTGATETVVSSVGSALIVKGEATRPVVLFTAAESFFLQAEAALTPGGLGVAPVGDPKSLYEKGVTESFKLDAGNGTSLAPTATVAVATTRAMQYLASGLNNVSWNTSANKLEAIITQKWLGLAFFDNYEAWTEWRRTGYPPVPLSDQAGGATQPRRLYYPISEQNTNFEKMTAEGVINVYTGRIFWDLR